MPQPEWRRIGGFYIESIDDNHFKFRVWEYVKSLHVTVEFSNTSFDLDLETRLECLPESGQRFGNEQLSGTHQVLRHNGQYVVLYGEKSILCRRIGEGAQVNNSAIGVSGMSGFSGTVGFSGVSGIEGVSGIHVGEVYIPATPAIEVPLGTLLQGKHRPNIIYAVTGKTGCVWVQGCLHRSPLHCSDRLIEISRKVDAESTIEKLGFCPLDIPKNFDFVKGSPIPKRKLPKRMIR